MTIWMTLTISLGSCLLALAIWQAFITPYLRSCLGEDAGIGFCWILLRWYGRIYHRLRIEGEDHLRGLKGPLIVVSNHSSPIDPFLIQAGLRQFVEWMMATDQMPPDTQLLWRFTRVIPTERRHPSSRAALQAIRRLRAGGIVGIFPEGRIAVPPRQILPFQPGIGELISHTGATVLLAHISGTSDSMTIAGAFLRPSRTVVHFVAPLSWPKKTDPAKITAELHDRLVQISQWPAARTTTPLPAEEDPFLP